MVWTALRSVFQTTKKNRPHARRTRPRIELLEDRTAPALLGNQLFPADHAWNQRIADAPVASNSAAIMNSIVNNFGNGRIDAYTNESDIVPVPGAGTIRQNGRYTAPARPGGPYTIYANAGGVFGTAKVTVVRSLLAARRAALWR